MSIRADKKYNGTIASGSGMAEAQSGTPFFQVMLECEDGDTYFPIWLTDKNREKALKYFEIIGADPSKLTSQSYIENELPVVITGREVSFGTREEEYNGKTSVKVSWIGKKSDPNLARSAAKFFGGNGNAPQQDFGREPIDDNDIPF